MIGKWKGTFCRNILDFFVMETITLRLFTIGASLHIWKICNNRGHGERNPHQGCRVSKIHKVGFELLRRNLPFLSRIRDKACYTEKSLIPIFTKESLNTSCSKEYFRIIFIHLSWSDIQKIRDNIFLVRIYLSHFWQFWLPGSHLVIKNKNFVLIDWNKKNLIPNFCRLATICKKKSYPEFLNVESWFSRTSEENSV